MPLPMDEDLVAGLGPLLDILKNAPKHALHDVQGRRAALAGVEQAYSNPTLPASVELQVIDIGGGLVVYHLRPRQQLSEPTSAVIYFHGGGLIFFSAKISLDHMSRIVRDTGTQVISVDYRLAPEHPYPAAIDDAWAALRWLRDNASTLGIDTSRIAVMGDSAGGCLAAALAIRARNNKLSPPIAQQLLLYPMLDYRTTGKIDAELVMWDEVDNATGWTAYLGKLLTEGVDVPDTASPALVKDVAGLPKLYLEVTQLDLLVKENLSYVQRFVEAGIETEFHLAPGLPHGFENFTPNHRVAKDWEENRKRVIRSL